jgi:hypothetical protein
MLRKPTEEYLDFLRNNKEEIEEFRTIQNYLENKIKEHIQYYIDLGFTPEEIQQAFKGITLIKSKKLNL